MDDGTLIMLMHELRARDRATCWMQVLTIAEIICCAGIIWMLNANPPGYGTPIVAFIGAILAAGVLLLLVQASTRRKHWRLIAHLDLLLRRTDQDINSKPTGA